MFKRSKKASQISIDDKKGHLFVGEKGVNLRLLMLRPIDLIEFSEFAGTNSDDITIWVGKTVGKELVDKLLNIENIAELTLSQKKEAILYVFATLIDLGYGVLTLEVKKDHMFITVTDSLVSEEKDNIMAKNICLLYQGIFDGIIEKLELDADSEEIECCLLGDDICKFKLELLVDEFDDADVDAEPTEGGGINNFLSQL